MDIRAILLTGVPGTTDDAATNGSSSAPETFSGTPLALLPILGRPVLHRVVDQFRRCGIESVSVLQASAQHAGTEIDRAADLPWKWVAADQIWRAAEDEFECQVQAGAELVLLMRLGAYAEVELDPLIQFHIDRHNHITQVQASDGAIDFFVLSGSRRNDAAYLLRRNLREARVLGPAFETHGYVNRLRTPADFRALALDSLMQKTSIRPAGEEVRPGIWLAAGARVNRNARLVAPCYVGASSKVRAGALITRGSSIEHHCLVDCGSVIEESTLLPLSYLGTGLDLSHSVVGSNRIFNARYKAELELQDATLVSTLPDTSVLRTLHHAANLMSFVPRQIVRGLAGERKVRESQVDSKCPPGTFDPSAVTRPVNQEIASTVVAGVREYGNQ